MRWCGGRWSASTLPLFGSGLVAFAEQERGQAERGECDGGRFGDVGEGAVLELDVVGAFLEDHLEGGNGLIVELPHTVEAEYELTAAGGAEGL